MGRKIKHNYDEVYKRHRNGESLKKISKDLGISIQSFYSHFQRMKWEYNKNIQPRHEGYYVNDNYLNVIDTEDKAYFLGWIFSDGTVFKNKLALRLKKSDIEIIKEMFSKFSNGYSVSENKTKTSKGIIISSNQLVEDLKNLGCIRNKSKIGFDIPNISNELFRHFVRGYFDGDGSISKRSARPNQMQVYICSPHKSFLEQLQNGLLEFNINSFINIEKRKGKLSKTPNGKMCMNNVDMYTLRFLSHKERLKFYEFLYKDCSIKLNRKYVLYNAYYANTVLILEDKNSNIVQRIGDETFINYDLITKYTFYFGKEVDKDLIMSLYNQGVKRYNIHKQTRICRSIVDRVVKEYNSPTSVRQPENG